MSGFAWLILNVALAVMAVGGTVAMSRWSAPELPDFKQSAPKGHYAAGSGTSNATGSQDGRLNGFEGRDDLWKNSLFQPGREEAPDAVAGTAAMAAAAGASQNVDFELIGVAQINLEGQEAVPVAILRNKRGNSRGAVISRGLPNATQNRNALSTSGASMLQNRKDVFRVGDKINDTGYAVQSIDVKKREVEIIRGSSTVRLSINFSNPDAVKRRESAGEAMIRERQKLALEEAQRIKATQEARAASASREPPMPPAPGRGTAAPAGSRNQNAAQTAQSPAASGTAAAANGGNSGAAQPLSTAPALNPRTNDSSSTAVEARKRIIEQLRQRRMQQQGK